MVSDIKERIEAMSLPAKGTIRQTMRAINRGALGLALLVEPETKRFMGLITDGDIRRALLNGYGLESPVSDIPRTVSKKAHVGTSADRIARMFSELVRVVPLLNSDGQVADLVLFD